MEEMKLYTVIGLYSKSSQYINRNIIKIICAMCISRNSSIILWNIITKWPVLIQGHGLNIRKGGVYIQWPRDHICKTPIHHGKDITAGDLAVMKQLDAKATWKEFCCKLTTAYPTAFTNYLHRPQKRSPLCRHKIKSAAKQLKLAQAH